MTQAITINTFMTQTFRIVATTHKATKMFDEILCLSCDYSNVKIIDLTIIIIIKSMVKIIIHFLLLLPNIASRIRLHEFQS